ncbi:hypothetical protein AOLI_G00297270 [Acnodon oligacanthus]
MSSEPEKGGAAIPGCWRALMPALCSSELDLGASPPHPPSDTALPGLERQLKKRDAGLMQQSPGSSR